jgi:transcriptional regulator with XRE-family HTH domain
MKKTKDYNVIIGKRVKAARKMKQITQEELAELTGISLSTISRLETGSKMTSIKTLLEIAKELQINVQYFFCDFADTKKTEQEASLVELSVLLDGLNENDRARLVKYVKLMVDTIKKE